MADQPIYTTYTTDQMKTKMTPPEFDKPTQSQPSSYVIDDTSGQQINESDIHLHHVSAHNQPIRCMVKFVDEDSFQNSLEEEGHNKKLRGKESTGKVVKRIDREQISVMDLTPNEANTWRSREDVKYVEVDNHVYPHSSQLLNTTEITPYGIDMVNALLVDDEQVSNRKVCILDSGYDMPHADLQQINVSGNDGVYGSWDEDTCDHGTHVAGTIAAIGGNDEGVVGVVRSGQINLHIVRLFSQNGCSWAWASDVVDALQRCVDVGANVANMSFGTATYSSIVDEALERMVNDDQMLLIASAGNSADDSLSYPASYDSVISVAAVDENEERAYFSTYNSQVDISAPGVSVYSTTSDSSYGFMSGTSMASPHVAGVAALVWSHFPYLDTTDIRNALEMTAKDLGPIGRDDYYGYGLVDAKAAYDYLEQIAIDLESESPSSSSAPSRSEMPSHIFTSSPSLSPSMSSLPTIKVTTSLLPSGSPSFMPTTSGCGDGVCSFFGGSVETCSSCPNDCYVENDDCGSIGDHSGYAWRSPDFYGIAFQTEALTDLWFYEIEVNAVNDGDNDIIVYTREGSYDQSGGMQQWSAVFEGTVSVTNNIGLIPLGEVLHTSSHDIRSFYITFLEEESIYLKSILNQPGVSAENEDLKLYYGDVQNTQFGSSLFWQDCEFKGKLRYMKYDDVVDTPTSDPIVTDAPVPSASPSHQPSHDLSPSPSIDSTDYPSMFEIDPSVTDSPSLTPSSHLPSLSPTLEIKPSNLPSDSPSHRLSQSPSLTPSIDSGTLSPSRHPSSSPTIRSSTYSPTQGLTLSPSIGGSNYNDDDCFEFPADLFLRRMNGDNPEIRSCDWLMGLSPAAQRRVCKSNNTYDEYLSASEVCLITCDKCL